MAQTFGFVAEDCKDLSRVSRAYKSGQLTPGLDAGKTHPWGGPPMAYLLLEQLGPGSSSAETNGNAFSALSLPLRVASGPVQVITRNSDGPFTLNAGGGTTSSLTGDSGDMQTALVALGLSCIVWGDGTVVHNDDGTTTTMAAGVWFVVFSTSATPDLITCTNSVVSVAWNRLEPMDITEEVYTVVPMTVGSAMKAGTFALTVPLPGLGPVVVGTQAGTSKSSSSSGSTGGSSGSTTDTGQCRCVTVLADVFCSDGALVKDYTQVAGCCGGREGTI